LGIRQAQVELEAEDTDVYMVSTLYMLPCAVNSNYTSGVEVHGASIHLSADGERWLGETIRKVTKRINVDGKLATIKTFKTMDEHG
jgi:hypothetical protein